MQRSPASAAPRTPLRSGPRLALGLPLLLLAACGGSGAAQDTSSTDLTSAAQAAANTTAMLQHWNGLVLDASGLDHKHPAPGDPRVFGEQLGPHRASRAMAIVHIAMYDAVQSVAGYYQPYTRMPAAPRGTTMGVAAAQAAHDAAAALWPSQKATFDAQLASDLAKFVSGSGKTNGIAVGKRAAANILALRANDGSQKAEPHVGIDFPAATAPGQWRPDPLVPNGNVALGYYWGQVKPFVLTSGAQFRLPPPPAMSSDEYASAYAEAQALGGDGVITPTSRTAYQYEVGVFWAYDGTPTLCAPPRLYNQIAMEIAREQGTTHDPIELSRYLAFLNTAMADAAIAAWDSKWFYNFWRPVVGIRESDVGTGPTGLGDGNPDTLGDPKFTPIGAPADNLAGPNFTPPFPSYPSGHGTFGGALFEAIRIYYGTDEVPFQFMSDEFNGVTTDNNGHSRPPWLRTFRSLSQAEEENGQSRIYLGIHWRFDKTSGIALGENVADEVFLNAFGPAF
jgi:hypothetical protein